MSATRVSRPLAIAVIGVALAALVLLAWRAWAPAAPQVQVAGHAASASESSAAAPQALSASAEAAPASQPASEAEAGNAMAANCGIGPLPDVNGRRPSNARLQQAAQDAALLAQRELVNRLRNSPDEVARAVGLMLAASDFTLPPPDLDACLSGSPANRNSAPDPAAEAACMAEGEKRQREVDQQRRTAAVDLEALIDQAQMTQSPAVYALALQACSGGKAATGRCAGLSNAHWAELDPDNAAPWLALAQDLANDPAAQDQAMLRAAQASRHDGDLSWVSQQVMQALPPTVQGQVRLQVEVAAMGVSTTHVYGGYQALGRWCSAEVMADPARRDTCGHFGELLSQHGRSMLDLGMGMRLGERTGQSPERLQALAARRQTYTDALSRIATQEWPTVSGQNTASQDRQCAAALRMSAYLSEVARDGELATISRFLKQEARR